MSTLCSDTSISGSSNGYGVCADEKGNIYFTCKHQVRQLTREGTKYVSISVHVTENCLLRLPCRLCLDMRQKRNLFQTIALNDKLHVMCDTYHSIWLGKLYVLAGNEEPGYVDGVGSSARFHFPHGIAISAEGSLFVADSENHRIRKINQGIFSFIFHNRSVSILKANTELIRVIARIGTDPLIKRACI